MKKKILIALLIIIVLIIGVIAYFLISDLKQEEKLISEINELDNLVNAQEINIEQIKKKLNKIETRGDYATVEKAFKQYLSDNFDNIIKISEILNDEKLVNILTAKNYQEDGPEFITTKEYITNTRQELEERKLAYTEFFTEEKAMSYINDKGLDSYYIDLYKNEIVGDIESANDTSEVENSIDEIISILNKSEEVINFLVENKNNWKIENDTIVFNNNNLADQYDELISQL